MDFFDKIKGSITNASDTYKMNSQIRENEKHIQDLLYQIGIQCFNTYGNRPGTEYDLLFQEIHRLQDENKRLQDAIAQMNAGVICQQCGTENPQGSTFCQNCGAPLNVVNINRQADPGVQQDGRNAQQQIICPNCGAVNAPGMKFCTYCGTRL